jgi:hypothetical protein
MYSHEKCKAVDLFITKRQSNVRDKKKIGKLNETFRLNFLHPDRFVIKTATNKIVVTLWGGQLDRKFQEIQIESRRRAFVSRCNKCD